MRIAEELASSVGKGLVAGLAGTAAMPQACLVRLRGAQGYHRSPFRRGDD